MAWTWNIIIMSHRHTWNYWIRWFSSNYKWQKTWIKRNIIDWKTLHSITIVLTIRQWKTNQMYICYCTTLAFVDVQHWKYMSANFIITFNIQSAELWLDSVSDETNTFLNGVKFIVFLLKVVTPNFFFLRNYFFFFADFGNIFFC